MKRGEPRRTGSLATPRLWARMAEMARTAPAAAIIGFGALALISGIIALPALASTVSVSGDSAPESTVLPQGHLLLNGGAAEAAPFWPKLFELAGGKDASIVILP